MSENKDKLSLILSADKINKSKKHMKVLVTGSAGHLGEALVRTLRNKGEEVIGVDIQASPFTTHKGSIENAAFVERISKGVDVIFHTATLHKPHVATHSEQDFIDTNITGTLNLLQAAVANGIKKFIFTSTTSVFGDALVPPPGMPAAWITEEVKTVPKNIYGVTKTAAEDLCQLFHRNQGLSVIILRTSRFFPEEDDVKQMQDAYAGDNLKANELLFRRVELEDAVSAHLLAAARAAEIGFGRYIISATSPFSKEDLADLRTNTPGVLKRYFPDYEDIFERCNWKMLPQIDRVYVNQKAREELGWQPKYDFRYVLDCLKRGKSIKSKLAGVVGAKGYHPLRFAKGFLW